MSDDKNLAKRSFKAASWVLIFQFASQGIQLLLGICMARLLSPDDYGVLGMLAIFWAVSNVFIQGGFGQALLQRKEITETDLSSVFYYNMFLAFLCCGIMLASAPWIAEFYRQPILRQTIMVSAWALPIGALSSIQRVILGRRLQQGFITASQLAVIPISGGVALYLAWRGYGVWALVWETFVSTACGTIFVCLFVRWIPKLQFSWKALGSLFQFGSKLMIAGLLDAFFANLCNVVIGKFYQAQTLGYYEQARRYSSLWPHSIQGAIAKVLFPAFSKIQDDLPRLKGAFKRSLSASVLAIVFPAFLLCTLSRPFIELLITSKWLPCIPIWWLLTCTIVLWPIHVLNLQLLNARGRSGRFLQLEIIKKCLALVSVAVLIFFGLYPMLVWGIFSSLTSAYLNSYYSGKEIDYGLFRQLRDVAIYAVLAALACFGAWGFYRLLYPYAPWVGFVGGACVGCVLYVALNFRFKTSAFFDLLGIVGGKVSFIKKFLPKQYIKQ